MKLLILACLAAALSGCSQTITVTEAGKVAESIGHVKPSKRDTCETQRQVAAQSSRIDTIIQGKETVYKPAPCKDSDPATS